MGRAAALRSTMPEPALEQVDEARQLAECRADHRALELELVRLEKLVSAHQREEARLDGLRERVAMGRARLEARHAELQPRWLTMREEVRELEHRLAEDVRRRQMERARVEAERQVRAAARTARGQADPLFDGRRRQIDEIARRFLGRGESVVRYCLALRLFEHTSEMVLPIRSLSARGAVVATEGRRLDRYPVGARHTLVVFSSDDVADEISVEACVVARQPGVLELDWSDDPESPFQIALLCD